MSERSRLLPKATVVCALLWVVGVTVGYAASTAWRFLPVLRRLIGMG